MSVRLAMDRVRILLAEHESELRATLRHGLQLAGHLVAEAGDGQQAMEILRAEPPELILLDLAIPAVGSVALLAELRAMRSRPRMRVIALTERRAVAVAIEAVRLGASDFLEKPVALMEVELSMQSVLHECLPDTEECVDGRNECVLEALRGALRAGTFAAAEAALMKVDPMTDSGFLNLAGILHEAHGRLNHARRYYERALAADVRCRPARENLKRLTELHEYGQTHRAVAFGEVSAAEPALTLS